MNLMRENRLEQILVVVGGVIPDQDIPRLKELGVAEVFLPGAPLKDITEYISRNAVR